MVMNKRLVSWSTSHTEALSTYPIAKNFLNSLGTLGIFLGNLPHNGRIHN